MSLLLRIFESDSFDLEHAIRYLHIYGDQSIGIVFYLVDKLQQFPASDVEFYWPQLCHLVLTASSASAALENYVVARCLESTHLAMLTMWYMTASLTDLSATPNSITFKTCRRVYNRVQAIIFADWTAPSQPTPNSLGSVEGGKVQPNADSIFAGIGVLTACLACPTLAKTFGPLVLEQGRKLPTDDSIRKVSLDTEARESNSDDSETDDNGSVGSPALGTALSQGRLPSTGSKRQLDLLKLKQKSDSSPPISRSAVFVSQSSRSRNGSFPSNSASSSQSHETPGKFAPNMLHGQSLSSLPLPSPTSPLVRKTSARFTDSVTASPGLSMSSRGQQSASVPSLSLSLAAESSTSVNLGSNKAMRDSNKNSIDVQKAAKEVSQPLLVSMLRSHACRAQLDLMNSLQDISTRLVAVPKLARISALRAELTVLNHGLPRGCCLGMECPGPVSDIDDQSKPMQKQTCSRHNRIVRISPSEAVVLNSADRAPFLMHVEVLEGDLDFDPFRRQNAEDTRAVLLEREEAVAKASLNSRPSSSTPKPNNDRKRNSPEKRQAGRKSRKPLEHNVPQPLSSLQMPETNSSRTANQPTKLSQVTKEHADVGLQEMDMVEQLYGDLGVAPEPEPSFSTLAQNRSVDEQAWARHRRNSSVSSTRSLIQMPELASANGQRQFWTAQSLQQQNNSKRKAMTLDEYAERMRMAAIMLSQLSENQQTPIGMVKATSGAASGLVGVGMGITAGITGAVGAGLGAVRDSLPFYGASNRVGQATVGIAAQLDTSSATTGLSAVQGYSSTGALLNSQISTVQRQKVLLPAEASAIRNRIMAEMVALEEERMQKMRADSRARASGWTSGTSAASFGGSNQEDAHIILSAVQKEDPSGAMFSESWADKRARIRASSPYGHLASWNVFSVIIKTGADLRQEQLATQLIREFDRIWCDTRCPHWTKYFRILVTSENTGLIETITDSISIHSIKKNGYARQAASINLGAAASTYTLHDYFCERFGEPSTPSYRKAQDCFAKSLASYSMVCYLLQIKDRHNGNILIDAEGHIIHIDFGFLLSNSPGSLGFEMAPWKMPQDYIDILGGFGSDKYTDFRKLLRQLFWDARKHAERIITIVDLMQKGSTLPCFATGLQTSTLLRERFQLGLTQKQCDEFVDRLLDTSALSVYTRLYDTFQSFSQGIL